MRDIPGFEGLYAITKTGMVWSYPKQNNPDGMWLKRWSDGNYLTVALCKKGAQETRHIHRLVMEVWGSPKQVGMNLVNHLDGNKLNNRLENLEWANRSTDAIHAYKLGLRTSCKGEAHGRSKLTEKQVLEMRAEYPNDRSLSRVAEKYKIDKKSVWRIINRKSWKHI